MDSFLYTYYPQFAASLFADYRALYLFSIY